MPNNDSPESRRVNPVSRRFIITKVPQLLGAMAVRGAVEGMSPPIEKYTPEQMEAIKLPVARAMETLADLSANRWGVPKIEFADPEMLEGAKIPGKPPLVRQFLDIPLGGLESLRAAPSLPPWIDPQPAVYYLPRISLSSTLPMNAWLVDAQGKPYGDLMDRKVIFPTASTLILGSGILGECWQLTTEERDRDLYRLRTKFLIRRTLPEVLGRIDKGSPIEAMANIRDSSIAVHFSDADGALTRAEAYSPTGLLCIPIEAEIEFFETPTPPTPKGQQA